MTLRRLALGAAGAVSLLVGACGPAAPEPARPAPASSAATTASAPAADGACLPLVHGCGCAYDCALATLATPAEPGNTIVQPSSGGPPLEVTLTSWCDGQPFGCAAGAPGFYDRTPCGGECIPTRAFDGCHLENGRCTP